MSPEMCPLLADMLFVVTFTTGTAVLYFHRILPILVVNGRYWQGKIKQVSTAVLCAHALVSTYPALLFGKLYIANLMAS